MPQRLRRTIRPHNIVAEADLFASVRNKAMLVGRRANATRGLVEPGLTHLPRRIEVRCGKRVDHAAGLAFSLSPMARASSYSREMSLFV